MDIHIGKLIEDRLSEVGMTKAEFGRRINTSRQNVNSMLRKESFDTAFLRLICRVLDYDFFRHLNYGPPPSTAAVADPGDRVKLVIELSHDHSERVLDLVLGKERRALLEQI